MKNREKYADKIIKVVLNFLLKFALPTLIYIATSIVTLAMLRKIIG